MANPEHLDILKQGVKVWNEWRKQHDRIVADLKRIYDELQGANLSGVNFINTNLDWSNLWQSDLSKANLSYTGFIRTNLQEANLNESDLSYATMAGAFLEEATLKNAILRETNLTKADLSGADLSGADLSGANLLEANLSGTQLPGANLERANLAKALLDRTNLTGANLTHCSVYGASVWNVQLTGATQLNLIITLPNESMVTVDDLEVAQFIYLLLNHQKLRNVLNAVTERGVLLLGRFGGGGLEVLQAVAARLREAQYLPIIFDFERPHDRDYTETVKTLAGLARFIIVDLSGPSVPQELSHTVPFFDIPFIPILEKGRKSYAMFVDLFKYPWVLKPPIEFADVEDLLARIPSEVIAPAEERQQTRQQLLDELFHRE